MFFLTNSLQCHGHYVIELLLGLSTGKTDKAAMKGRKKKAHMSAKKDSVSSDTSKSKKKLFHFTSRSSLSMSAADRQNDVLPKHTSDFEVKI